MGQRNGHRDSGTPAAGLPRTNGSTGRRVRARRPFEWSGYAFDAGAWLLLDLYGTNHDQRIWDHPDTFCPERFEGWEPSPYEMVPQGGGAYEENHRCPGEHLTQAAIARMVTLLASTAYRVPAQDLGISLSRMPTMPASGFVIYK